MKYNEPMITYVPNYYSKFKCIASNCSHTCCKGWEIDVDSESLKRYQNFPDIMNRIKDGSYVLQGEEERCPFLREDLLCQMIIDHGEDFICDICKDHPRFRNYYDNRIEMGLGLCCEAACDLIINNEMPFALVPNLELSSDISTMLNRDADILDRLTKVASTILDEPIRQDMYRDMEKLDAGWENILADAFKVDDVKTNSYIGDNSLAMEQVAVYYLYRYPKIPSFAVEASIVIAKCAISMGGSRANLLEAARMYSSEVEYSDENMDIIYDFFDGDIDD